MKKLKRGIRLLLFIFILILATLGVGITGVAPPAPKSRERKQIGQKELLEEIKEDGETAELENEVK